MNYPARIFRDLSSVWQRDAASERVERLAAELVACVAAQGTLCLGLIRAEAVSKHYGLVYLLDSYGILLRKRYRKEGGVLVFAEVKQAPASEFAGAVVFERAVVPPTAPATVSAERELAYAA